MPLSENGMAMLEKIPNYPLFFIRLSSKNMKVLNVVKEITNSLICTFKATLRLDIVIENYIKYLFSLLKFYLIIYFNISEKVYKT